VPKCSGAPDAVKPQRFGQIAKRNRSVEQDVIGRLRRVAIISALDAVPIFGIVANTPRLTSSECSRINTAIVTCKMNGALVLHQRPALSKSPNRSSRRELALRQEFQGVHRHAEPDLTATLNRADVFIVSRRTTTGLPVLCHQNRPVLDVLFEHQDAMYLLVRFLPMTPSPRIVSAFEGKIGADLRVKHLRCAWQVDQHRGVAGRVVHVRPPEPRSCHSQSPCHSEAEIDHPYRRFNKPPPDKSCGVNLAGGRW